MNMRLAFVVMVKLWLEDSAEMVKLKSPQSFIPWEGHPLNQACKIGAPPHLRAPETHS